MHKIILFLEKKINKICVPTLLKIFQPEIHFFNLALLPYKNKYALRTLPGNIRKEVRYCRFRTIK